MKTFLLSVLILFSIQGFAQKDVEQELKKLNQQLEELKQQESELESKIELVTLEKVRQDIAEIGLPEVLDKEEVIVHKAMSLVYDENHEQAKWVAHIITPGIIKGNVIRTNDFRVDDKVKTGSTVEEDYFLKTLKPNGEYEYDGFGYDRGHLAPSADFRWSQEALSESYFYSNMSPQLGDFNRGRWAELEGFLRGYIYRNNTTQLHVVTGPVLKEGLPVIERSINKVSIPEQYFKVVLDMKNKRGIAFLMPNQKLSYPIESYAVSIDKVEELTGINFFPNVEDALEDKVEQQTDIKVWMPNHQKEDVKPLYPPSLPRNSFNTVHAKSNMSSGKTITICGTIVSGKLSRKGNLFLNLDKKYPNQPMSIFIKKEDLLNFSYNPYLELMGMAICVKGKIIDLGGTPTMIIKNEKAVDMFTPQ